MKQSDQELLNWAHALYQRELSLQQESLYERSRDADFYDGDQFTAEERAIYDQRDQVPRVFNEIKPTIDWMLGSERRARADWSVLPRSEDDVELAQVKTKLIKYIDDINKARFCRSLAYADCVKSGEGWTRTAVEPNEDGHLIVKLTHEHWRNMLRDSTCRDTLNFTDCRYIWSTKPVELETLQAWFPDKKDALTADAGDEADLIIEQSAEMQRASPESIPAGMSYRRGSMSIIALADQSDRKAVRVWELWYRKTERVQVLRKAGGLNGERLDEQNPLHQFLVKEGSATVVENVREQMYMMLYTESVVLYHGPSIYAHNRFPFVCRTAFINDSTGMPYGAIRQLRDIQSDLNARRNKALFLMSTSRVIMDDDAVEDINDLACEVARPNGIIAKKAGKELQIQDGAVLAPQHVAMAEQDAAYIRQVAGVTGENRGMDTTGKSGIAIQALQEQGTVLTTALVDNHALAHQCEGELILSLCEQYIDHEMQFRITGDSLDKPEFVSVNTGDPATDITASQADFIVSERDYRQTMRQALSEQMLQVSGSIVQASGDPQMAIALIEMAIDLQDLPNKDQITSRLRSAAGLPPKNETDDAREAREQAEAQQAQQAQQQQQALQEQAFRLAKARADEMECQADERRAEAERERANAVSHKINATKSAYAAAALIQNAPHIAPVADDLLRNLDAVLPTQTNTPALKPESAPEQSAAMPQDTPPQGAMPPAL